MFEKRFYRVRYDATKTNQTSPKRHQLLLSARHFEGELDWLQVALHCCDLSQSHCFRQGYSRLPFPVPRKSGFRLSDF
jgi:hypothetical protein